MLYAVSFYGITEKNHSKKITFVEKLYFLTVQILVHNSYKKIFSQYIQHGLDSKIRNLTRIKSRTVTFYSDGGGGLLWQFYFLFNYFPPPPPHLVLFRLSAITTALISVFQYILVLERPHTDIKSSIL
jgi:hypothetical protein